jgi:hypothetical protein
MVCHPVGATGLFDEMNKLSVAYQHEQIDLTDGDPVRILIVALQGMMQKEGVDRLEISPTKLAEAMNGVAQADELDYSGEIFTNPKKVGAILRRLRIHRGQRTSGGKRWSIEKQILEDFAKSYGIIPDVPESVDKTRGDECRCAVSAVSAEQKGTPSEGNKVGTDVVVDVNTSSTENKVSTDTGMSAVCAEYAVSAEQKVTPLMGDKVGTANSLEW